MNGWDFDWISGLVGFTIGAVAVGFLSKAGEPAARGLCRLVIAREGLYK